MSAISPVLLILCVSGVSAATSDDIVDLSVTLRKDGTMGFPGWEFQFERLDKINMGDGSVWREAYGIKTPIHVATHVDVPCHTRRENTTGWQRMHDVPLEKFFGPGAIIDVREKVNNDPAYGVTAADIMAWEETNGRIPEGAVVLVHTGWAKKSGGSLEAYWGSDNLTLFEQYVHPYVAEDAAKLLAEDRDINALGIDIGSPDPAAVVGPVHLELLGNNRIIIENVADTLELLPPTGYRIHIVPLKLYDTCGAPVRLLAFKEPEDTSGVPGIRARATLAVMVAMIARLMMV